MEWIWIVLVVFVVVVAIALRRSGGTDRSRDSPAPAAVNSDWDREWEKHLEDERKRRIVEDSALVDGKHYTQWVPKLDKLRTEKRDADALKLLFKCIDATEREAEVHNELFPPTTDELSFVRRGPAPAYYERAAIIYRRRKDYASEIEILDRWEEKSNLTAESAGVSGKRLSARKARAIELMNSR